MRKNLNWFRSGLPSAAIAVAAVALVAGCSHQNRRFWLNVFFEGVPPEGTNHLASGTLTGSSPGAATLSAPSAKPAEPFRTIHRPYAEQKCSTCHESGFSQKMRASLVEVCLGCHNGLLTEGKAWHAPAAAGDCAFCHEPHDAARPFLLKQPPNALCAQCHEPVGMTAIPAHRDQEKADCAGCHNPHQGSGRFLLRSKSTPAVAVPANPGNAASAPAK
jgi:predicted CXXCH cytochrome family protein